MSVVSRLEHACLDARNPVARQIHGFLLGPTPKIVDGQYVVRISDYWLLPPPDPRPRVDRQQVDRFRAELAGDTWPDGGALDVLGYWRTELGAEAKRLQADEASWVNSCFPEPFHLILSIQNRQGRSPAASFLVRDKDGFVPFSLLEFPLNADKLRLSPGGEQLEVPGPRLAPARPEPGPPTPRRPIAWTSRLSWKRASAAYVGLGTAFLLTAGALILRDRFPGTPRTTTPAPSPSPSAPAEVQQFATPLALKVETAGDGLQVLWRLPASASPENLVGGRLLITENGKKPRSIDLTSGDLRQGRLFYQPTSDQIQVQLDVLLLKGGLVQDSILAFGPRSAQSPATTDVRTSPEEAKATSSTPSALGSREPTSVTSPNTALNARVVIPPPSRSVSVDAEPPQLSDRPPSLPQSVPNAAESVNKWTQTSLPTAPRPVPPPSVEERSPAPAVVEAARPVRTSALDSYRPPVPVEQKHPKLERELWSRVMRDVPIEVRVHVDKSGRVIRTEPVQRGSVGVTQALTVVAQQTAARWKFKPATLGGQPVEADHTVRFVFHPMSR